MGPNRNAANANFDRKCHTIKLRTRTEWLSVSSQHIKCMLIIAYSAREAEGAHETNIKKTTKYTPIALFIAHRNQTQNRFECDDWSVAHVPMAGTAHRSSISRSAAIHALTTHIHTQRPAPSHQFYFIHDTKNKTHDKLNGRHFNLIITNRLCVCAAQSLSYINA